MYIADQNLISGSGALVYAAGSEVPEEALKSDMGKRQGWKDYVSEARTKTLRADGPGTDKPADPTKSDSPAVPSK
jgi:hypothetical protein